MIYAVIGHRGVGKTKFLSRVTAYHRALGLAAVTFDLDEEICRRRQRTIDQIFAEQGEQGFRRTEIEVFRELLIEVRNETKPVYIALGAGFQGALPLNVKVIWLRRPTDRAGRIFLDRPRLNAELSPLAEYERRREERDRRFEIISQKELWIGEGFSEVNDIEPVLLGLLPYDLGASMTVLPRLFGDEIRLEDFIADKLLLGLRYFELRDDLLSAAQMERFTREVPKDRLLVSFRSPSVVARKRPEGITYDWAMELGECPFGAPPVLSLHRRDADETVEEAGARLVAQPAEHYKLAVEVNDFVELWQGHQWYQADPAKRSFLPMSRDGRWQWYRSLFGRDMRINFVCDAVGSAPDQPTLFDYIRVQKVLAKPRGKAPLRFAAILGDPVAHSRTPAEQGQFFAEKGWPAVAVRLTEKELNEINLGILRRLGLSAAAVTAPLKQRAYKLCHELTDEARALQSVNTLAWDEHLMAWRGANTDILGLRDVFAKMRLPRDCAVWGGGGTVQALAQLLPTARFYSARAGELRAVGAGAAGAEAFSPQLVIWAVGRGRMDACQYPPTSWRPLMILDLNYTEDSPGREYAQRVGAQYISGIEMFRAQAEAQRQFWSRESRPTPERSL